MPVIDLSARFGGKTTEVSRRTCIVIVEVSDGDLSYPTLQGDYAAQQATWASQPIVAGTPLAKPSPLFTKLDDKLGQTGPSWAPIAD